MITNTAFLAVALCAGCAPAAIGATAPSRTAVATPPPGIRPIPTARAPLPPAPPTPARATPRREIPLRRSDGNATWGDDGQVLYRLVEEREGFGDAIAARLDGDEMMCVRYLDLSPARCTCWIGPLENAGVRGGGFLAVRRIVILSGSAEEAALALVEDWNAGAGSAAEREACTGDSLSIAYAGGVFRPEP